MLFIRSACHFLDLVSSVKYMNMQDFHFKSKGSPFGSFSLTDANKFVARAKTNFRVKFANTSIS